jgi:hypothetical protein
MTNNLGQCPNCKVPLRRRTTESGIGMTDYIAVCDTCCHEYGDEWTEYNHVWLQPKPKPLRRFGKIMSYGAPAAAAWIGMILKGIGIR